MAERSPQERWHSTFNVYTFLQAFPAIILLFNISLYCFIFLYITTLSKFRRFRYRKVRSIQFFAFFFGLGAFISVVNMPNGIDNPNFLFSLRYLPNYIYWSFLIIFLVRYRRLINYDQVSKYIYYGVICFIPFFFLRENFLGGIPILQKTSFNNFAFLMICFSPIAISYIKRNRGIWPAIIAAVLTLSILLFLERRAGFLLVGLSSIVILFVNKVSYRTYFSLAFISGILFIAINLTVVENSIKSTSERIHQIIYEFDELQKTERSYLTRLAMFEKGMNFFRKYPFSGIGILNFSRVEGEIEGDFEGAKYVIYKDINNLSAHNSYVVIFSEGGLVMTIPFALLHLRILIFILFNHKKIDKSTLPFFVSYVAMLIHFNAIAAVVNVYAWFIAGLSASLVYRIKES